MQTIGDANTHKYPQIPNAQTEDANWVRHTLWFQTEDAEREGDREREQQSKKETEQQSETERETEREIESVWESLTARLSKSERVEREIERVAVGMKFISWVFQFEVREEVLILL